MKTTFLFLSMAFGACATARPAPAPEVVGQLSASYGSVMSAPVARSTDLATSFQAIDSDDGPAVADVGDRDVKPEVAAKQAHGF